MKFMTAHPALPPGVLKQMKINHQEHMRCAKIRAVGGSLEGAQNDCGEMNTPSCS
jgi:hypothetical protein